MPNTTPHKPNDKTRAEVSALCSFGIPQSEIAVYVGIDAKTLRKHYRDELDVAHTKANAQVGRFLLQNASGQTIQKGASYSDCVRAAMFWAKTRMGWRETSEMVHLGDAENPVQQVVLTAADYKAARVDMISKDDV